MEYERALQNKDSEDIHDLKLNISPPTLMELIGAESYQALLDLFGDSFTEILIRRCEAHGQFINFHTDVSKKTM
jgi:hypothetical protein